MEKFIINAENKFDMTDEAIRWTGGSTRVERMAKAMSNTDMFRIANLCGGDFYRLSDDLMRALGLKAEWISNQKKEQAETAKRVRQENAARFHQQIMSEIRELMADTATFTAEQVQLTAYLKQYQFIRSIHMYAAHLRKACEAGEAKKRITWHDTIPFILRPDYHGQRTDTRISTGRALYSLI